MRQPECRVDRAGLVVAQIYAIANGFLLSEEEKHDFFARLPGGVASLVGRQGVPTTCTKEFQDRIFLREGVGVPARGAAPYPGGGPPLQSLRGCDRARAGRTVLLRLSNDNKHIHLGRRLGARWAQLPKTAIRTSHMSPGNSLVAEKAAQVRLPG